MVVMNYKSLQNDKKLKRAISYPYDITSNSFTFIKGESEAFDILLTKGRYPVIGYGSNQSPQRLREKYGVDHSAIPVQRGWLEDHDVVYSAHFASYGSIPAALTYVKGSSVSVAVNWLNDEQLEIMHGTEWDNYNYAQLTDISLKLQEGTILTEAYAYLCFTGYITNNGSPIALTEVAAKNRIFDSLNQIEILTLVRDKLEPKMKLDDFLREQIVSKKIRQERTQKLRKQAIEPLNTSHVVISYT